MRGTYTFSLVRPQRRKTREVRVGDVTIGGQHPIAVQSMTTTSTLDTKATVDQISKLIDVGCDIVRVTTPMMADAENVPNIKAEMKRRNLRVPLVADVHFLPQVALKVCECVEKVRINPGNYADRKKFDVKEYTDTEYDAEIGRIREAFVPLVRKAKEYGVAMRIGTNHGSLSDRIMNRYGDTPLGMVESALEFLRIAEDEGYRDIILSMKSSNTRVMIQAYRLLVAKMNEYGMDYPLHLGVTEAGDGEDGRIKSSIGIGSLLADGLGDTIRVSLTEDPEHEVPVARRIANFYSRPFVSKPTKPSVEIHPAWDFFSYDRRVSDRLAGKTIGVGEGSLVRVRTDVTAARLEPFVSTYGRFEPKVEIVSMVTSPELASSKVYPKLAGEMSVLLRAGTETPSDLSGQEIPFDQLSIRPSPAWSEPKYLESLIRLLGGRPLWLRVNDEKGLGQVIPWIERAGSKVKIGLEIEGNQLTSIGRMAAAELSKNNLRTPIHLRYVAKPDEPAHDILVRASVEIGCLLCDGIGDSIEVSSSQDIPFNHRLAFNILQAGRLRMTKTEYIACPSCGRTLFDLQETTARIRSRTSHLKGVKIAIMGCIVNGPGEMADADFGYVGSGPGFINLYVGKECVERHVPQAEADHRLVNLIKSRGQWVDPT
ncbi:MAG TPA: (E)-4-hydroxy-3-methylbut-2-enyl-diphosphate synthase [Bdellovibrionota bacterium]|nr:(E)-4-hydroxy-3-methylbut-2-enyl-diphosphate synthase [Bdellovibrionota bacterium]